MKIQCISLISYRRTELHYTLNIPAGVEVSVVDVVNFASEVFLVDDRLGFGAKTDAPP